MNSNTKFTPAIIVSSGGQFIVPLYQRLFAWSKKEVSELLLDLRTHFEQHPGQPYYLGVVTTIIDKNKYCLVDGQQRFTVLMLMASVFRHFSENWNLFFDMGKRLELFAREKDELYLSKLSKKEPDGGYVNVLMRDAYTIISKFVEEIGDEKQDFTEACFKHITIFNSILPNEYVNEPSSLNKYFEVMNSAGVNLEQHEILKVTLLEGMENQSELLTIWNLCSDFSRPLLKKKEDVGLYAYSKEYESLFNRGTKDALYKILDYDSSSLSKGTSKSYPTIAEIDVKAEDFDNPFSDNNERSVVTFPEFLLLTLDIYKNNGGGMSFYKTDNLTETFSKFLTKSDVQGFYECMLKLRIALDCYVIRRKVDGQDSRYSLTYRNENESVSHDCLMQYEAMLYVSTPYYKWVKELLKYLNDGDNDKSTESILAHLKKWDNNQHSHPVEKDKMTYDTIDRYWFWRLDYYLWEHVILPKETEDEDESSVLISYPKEYHQSVLDYVFRANRSIEHLHPQNQSNNEEWSRKDIDSFGNLAMISQSFNSQQSNEDVHVKFSRVESQARNKALQSLKLLRMYLDAKGNPDGWTNETAQKHGDEMIDYLNSTFEID